jgi:hypothetical protein
MICRTSASVSNPINIHALPPGRITVDVCIGPFSPKRPTVFGVVGIPLNSILEALNNHEEQGRMDEKD